MKKRYLGICEKITAFVLAFALIFTTVLQFSAQEAKAATTVSITEAAGWFESAYAEWSPVSGATAYNVYVKEASASDSAYVQLDNELVRQYPTYWRADALGLKAGNYVLKVEAVTSSGSVTAVTDTLTVSAYDRTGFGWVNGTSSGAYNDDGTLKSDAVVVYITQDTVDSVEMTVKTGSKDTNVTECTGITNILLAYKKGYETRPLAIRIIGTVNNDGLMTTDSSNFAGDFVIKGSGDSNRLSCGITVEGVGEDATALGWGVRIANASNVEVRNLGFMLCDSGEGDNVGLQQSDDHIWVHNCDMFYGLPGSDSDQAKGDGALDCKKSTYVTFSYNHFVDNGKCNLLGLSEGTTEGLYITYHHNWYDHSDSRHPRVRYYSAHVYNNYYDGTAKYGVGSTLGSSVFVEANYFRNCPYPILTSMQGSDVFAGGTTRDVANNATFSKEAGGTVKAFNNIMTGTYTFIPYGSSTYVLKGSEVAYNLSDTSSTADFDAVVVSSASEQISSSVTSYTGSNTYNNFDTSSVMYSYKADDPADVPTVVTASAGRMNGGDFTWEFDNSVDDADYSVNEELLAALKSYKSSLVSVGGGSTTTVTKYSVKVNGGSASATSAAAGTEITITATPASGQTFTNWTVVSGGVTLSSTTSATATFTMPAANVEITAVYDSSSSGGESGGGESGGGEVVTGDAQIWTYNSTNSYFTIGGSLSTNGGTQTVEGSSYEKGLKLDSKGSITFTTSGNATVVIYVIGKSTSTGNAIKIDSVATKTFDAALTKFEVEVGAGTHIIEKGTNETYVYYVSVTPESTSQPEADADYTAVNEAIAKVPSDLSIYTDETAQAVTDAVNAVVTGKKASEQSVVDGYATAINNAVAALVLKDADYTAVDEALAKVPSDLSKYTDETVQAVTDAVNAVVTGKKITEQAAVDAMAKAIEDAVAALVEKFVKNGIYSGGDGNFYYYENDVVVTSYTGLKYNANDDSWWLVQSGKVASDYTGFFENGAGKWYVVTGKIDITFTGLALEDGKWLCVVNGKYYPEYNGMVQNGGSWWYVVNGELDTSYSGLFTNDGGTWFVKNGKIATDSTGIFTANGQFYYVVSGKAMVDYTGLVQNNGAFWYIENGIINTDYTGIFTNSSGKWYVVGGKLNTTATTVTIDGVTYTLSNGKVVE